MKFTIQTHDSYPEDDRLELPAVDFNHSRKIPGYWQGRLIHAPMSAEVFPSKANRRDILSEVIEELVSRLLTEESKGADIDYTLHVYMVGEE